MNSNARLTHYLIALLIVLLLFVNSAIAAPDIDNTSEPLISFLDGRLTVHEDNADLSEILITVAEQAGFAVTIYGELEHSGVSRQIVDMPLDSGLQALLRNVNSMLVYAANSPTGELRIDELRVVGSNKLKSAQPISKTVYKLASFFQTDKNSLIRELQQSDIAARLYALQQIHQMAEADALDILRKVLQQDADHQVRNYAIELLGEIGSEAALETMQSGLGDTDARVRMKTIETLGFFAGEKAVPVLGQLLFSEADRMVRLQAIETIATQPRSDAVNAFLQMAANDPDSQIREFAAGNLTWY